jgi:hypothetical protein
MYTPGKQELKRRRLMMSTVERLQCLSREVLKPILHNSGHLLYSAAATVRPGRIYLLGHNPGGCPGDEVEESLERSIEEITTKTSNEYLDDSWNGRAPGSSVLQKRVRWLLEHLGEQVREVCASNLIFARSNDAASSRYAELADMCWPVHEYLLRVVQPTFVLVFGNSNELSPYHYIKGKLGVAVEHEPHSSGHGNWQLKACQLHGGTMLVGLPHLSRYAIDNHPEIIRWIRDLRPKAI